MGNEWPVLSEAVVCALCGRQLLPLTYTRLSLADDPMGAEKRPGLKCAGCGHRYQWQGSAGWEPLGQT